MPLKNTQISFKNLFNKDKAKAMYYLRQVLSDLDLYASDDSLISIKIVGNRLYILSFCPDVNFSVPQFFMYDDTKTKRMSTPTLYNREKLLLDTTSSMVKVSTDLFQSQALEMPFRLMCYELKQNLMFGEYKSYFNFFCADKINGNKNIPDELEILILKSIFQPQLAKIDIYNSNISEFRKKYINFWARNEVAIKDTFFKEKDTIFEASLMSLIKIAEQNSTIQKKAS